jgi:palmitoyltransferase
MKPADYVLKATPLIIFGIAAYFLYAYCFRFCWKHVGGGPGIVMISIFAVLLSLIYICWLEIIVLGPGYVPKRQSMELEQVPNEMPQIFMCDPEGFRQWCSHCKTVKIDRSHHATQLGRCVPRMDHYCGWLGMVIGEGNIKLFIQIVFYFWLIMIYTVITLLIFAHSGGISALFIVLYAISGAWILLLTGFLGVHIRYVLINITTIENMDLGRMNYPIYNFECNGRRVVLRLQHEDFVPQGPYSQGYWNNWKMVMGSNALNWLMPIPLRSAVGNDAFNEKLLQVLRLRYLSGKEGYPAFLQPGQNEGPKLAPAGQGQLAAEGPGGVTD